VGRRKSGTVRSKLAFERHREILDLLESSGAVRVTEAARQLGVTQETVRRDLDKLFRAGRLRRTHGGAVPVAGPDQPFAVRAVAHHDEKRAIARAAADLLQPGDVIALDASSTAHELALLLQGREVTVVTNALPATMALCQQAGVRVMSTGGWLDPASQSWTGAYAEAALTRVHIRKLFLSSKGVDLLRGLSELDEAQAALKRRLIAAAEEVYLLVDHSKFDQRAVVYFAALDEVDAVITDGGAGADLVARLRGTDLRVLVAGTDPEARENPDDSEDDDDDQQHQ
jgi:DeoR/GlpR family transcriptional regulator of sugar metabolism